MCSQVPFSFVLSFEHISRNEPLHTSGKAWGNTEHFERNKTHTNMLRRRMGLYYKIFQYILRDQLKNKQAYLTKKRAFVNGLTNLIYWLYLQAIAISFRFSCVKFSFSFILQSIYNKNARKTHVYKLTKNTGKLETFHYSKNSNGKVINVI